MKNNIFSKIKNKKPGFALVLITVVLAVSLMCLTAACTSEDASTAAIGTAAAAGISGLVGIYICFFAVAWAAGIFLFVVWIISLVDCAKRENLEFPSPSESTKVMWILIIVLAGGIGAIIYYFLVMKKMPRKK